jgi:hypothetical protein
VRGHIDAIRVRRAQEEGRPRILPFVDGDGVALFGEGREVDVLE